jgi:hypothetical protein
VTLQYRTADVRNNMLDAFDTAIGTSGSLRIYTGAQPADPTQANSGTLLAHINLPNPAFGAAAAGAMAKNGTWQDASADGGSASTPGHCRFYNSQVTMDGTTCQGQGSAGIGSGDINFDGTITAGQQVTINTCVITEGNP